MALPYRKRALDFLLSLVPFYDYVRLLNCCETSGTLQPCALDTLALVPVIGEASTISLHFDSALDRSGLFAVRCAVKVLADEQLLTSALRQGGAVFVHHGVLPLAQQSTPRAFASFTDWLSSSTFTRQL